MSYSLKFREQLVGPLQVVADELDAMVAELNTRIKVLQDSIQFSNGSTNSAITANIATTGTWAPTDVSGAGLTLTTTTALFHKAGRLCYASADVTYPATASGAQASIGGLPFTNTSTNGSGVIVFFHNVASDVLGNINTGTKNISWYKDTAGTSALNSDFTTRTVRFAALYITAE